MTVFKRRKGEPVAKARMSGSRGGGDKLEKRRESVDKEKVADGNEVIRWLSGKRAVRREGKQEAVRVDEEQEAARRDDKQEAVRKNDEQEAVR